MGVQCVQMSVQCVQMSVQSCHAIPVVLCDPVSRHLEAELLLPRDASKLPMGPFPGSEEPLALAPGGIMIKKKKSFFAFADEYLILGKWRATPLEDG